MVEQPLLRIDFHIGKKGRHLGRGGGRGKERGDFKVKCSK